MELAKVENLLEKYINAETSLEEETLLKKYFLSDTVAPHLQDYQKMFAYFDSNKSEVFDQNIKIQTRNKTNYKWLSIAVSFALLISIITYSTLSESPQNKKIEISSLNELPPKVLNNYEELEKALKLFSVNLNKGNNAFKSLYAYENSINKVFKLKSITSK